MEMLVIGGAFLQRATEVQAFRWTGIPHTAQNWPQWARERWALGQIEVMGDALMVKASSVLRGGQLAPRGWWVVLKPDGEVVAVSPERFVEAFEPLDE